jgi:hypothetical protein
MPEVKEMKKLMKLFWLRADVAARGGDWPAVVDSLRVIDRASRHAMQQPAYVSHLVGIGGLGLEVWQIRTHLASPALGDSARQGFLESLQFAFKPPPTMGMALQTERDLLLWQLSREIPSIVMPPARVGGEIDRYLSPISKLAALPGDQMLDPEHALRAQYQKACDWDGFASNPVRSEVHRAVMHMDSMLVLHGKLIAEQRGTQTLVAILRYELENQQLPASLSEIGAELPVDPFTAQPFLYRVTDDGFTLYCAGLDRDDDGGVHDKRWGERWDDATRDRLPPDGDYVFWPLPEE